MAGFKRPTSNATTAPAAATADTTVANNTEVKKDKVYPTYDLQTKDEEGKLIRLCGLFQKVDKKGRPMWIGNDEESNTVFFLFSGKNGLNLHCAPQVAKGEKRPPMQQLVTQFYENTAKSGLVYNRGKDEDGTEFLVFKYTPKKKEA